MQGVGTSSSAVLVKRRNTDTLLRVPPSAATDTIPPEGSSAVPGLWRGVTVSPWW